MTTTRALSYFPAGEALVLMNVPTLRSFTTPGNCSTWLCMHT